MSRRELRKIILQILYRDEFHDKAQSMVEARGGDFFPKNAARFDKNGRLFVERVLRGIAKHKAEIDQKISTQALGWRMERISLVDLNIMRFAVYEMLFSDETPDKSALNEALELAKAFGEEKSVSFINGILDQILKSKA